MAGLLGKPTKPQWADGNVLYATEPSAGKKSTGWLSQEKPPFQWMNWLFLKIKEWLDFGDYYRDMVFSILFRSDAVLTWNAPNIAFTQDLEFIFKIGADVWTNSIPLADSALSLADGEVLVGIFDDSDLVLTSAAYGVIASGNYSVVAEGSLTANTNEHEIIIFRRRGTVLEIPLLNQILENADTFTFAGTSIHTHVSASEGGTLTWANALSVATAGNHAHLDDTTGGRLLHWIQAALLGNAEIIAGSGAPAITALSGTETEFTDIAYIDATNDDLRVYRFSNSLNWAQRGNDLNIAGVVDPKLTALSSTDVAFIDTGNEDLRVYRFDGTDWAQVGNDLNITAGILTPAITALNSTDIALVDQTDDDLRIYRFDGTDWAYMSNEYIVAGGISTPTLTTINGTDIVLSEAGAGSIRTYRFSFATNKPYSAAGGAF